MRPEGSSLPYYAALSVASFTAVMFPSSRKKKFVLPAVYHVCVNRQLYASRPSLHKLSAVGIGLEDSPSGCNWGYRP